MTTTCTELYFKLKFGQCNGSMMVQVSANDQPLITFADVTDEFIEYSTTINLPTSVIFSLSNKNLKDTVVNDGIIVADKYVQLQELKLGRIPLNPATLHNVCVYTNKHGETKNTFWGFNGTVSIDFNDDYFIKWHLKNKNLFEL